MAFDPYKILGVDPQDDLDTIKKAYKQLCQMYHPDKNDDPYAETKFKHIREAWDIIKNPERRARSDRGESTKVHDVRSQALNLIVGVLYEAIQQQGPKNIIENTRRRLSDKRQETNNKHQHLLEIVGMLKEATQGYDFDGVGTNIITDALLAKKDQMATELEAAERLVKATSLAGEILDDYKDHAPEVFVQQFIAPTTSTS